MSKILVIGSLSIDNVTYTKVLPGPGTTVFGESFLSNIGGKGAIKLVHHFSWGDVNVFGSIGRSKRGLYYHPSKSLAVKGFLKDSTLE